MSSKFLTSPPGNPSGGDGFVNPKGARPLRPLTPFQIIFDPREFLYNKRGDSVKDIVEGFWQLSSAGD
jgi:hypothetical protein